MSRARIGDLLLLIALFLPMALAGLYFNWAAPRPGTATQTSPMMVGLYAVAKVVQFVLPVVAWRITDPERLKPTRPRWHGLGPALAFGAVSALGIVCVYLLVLKGHPLLADMPEQIRRKITSLGIGTPARYILFSIFVAVIHSGLEEYYWRAYVFDGLQRRLPAARAILISALAFTGHHIIVIAAYQPNRVWTGVMPLSAGVFLGGAVWSWLYHRYTTAYPSWVSHVLIDIAIMAVGFDMAFATPPV